MQRESTLTRAKLEWEQYLSPKEPHEGSNMTSNETKLGGNYWSTTDELNRLRILADVDPVQLLAAYNGTRIRSDWGSMDGDVVQREASKLARRVLFMHGESLSRKIKPEWPWALRLAKGLQNG